MILFDDLNLDEISLYLKNGGGGENDPIIWNSHGLKL